MEILSTSKESKVLDAKRFIASEVNLSRLPFFASSTKGLKQKRGVGYRHVALVQGQEVEVLWEVTANVKYGYPGPLAEAVHTAILQIVTERGFPVQNPVTFTFYDVCKRLGLKPSGKIRRLIREGILSTRSALIEINRSFATKDGRRPTFTDTQNLYSRAIFYGDQDPHTNEPIEYSAIWFADFYIDSLNSGYFRPLDFEYFKQIRKASYASPKLYRYLGYRFSGSCFKHNNKYSKVDYDDLAAIADIKRQPNLSLAKQKLAKAHKVLLDTGFLSREPVWQVEKQGRGKPKKFFILYHPGARAHEEYRKGRRQLTRQLEFSFTESGGVPSPKNPTKTLTQELFTLGVSKGRAHKIVKSHTPEEINLQLDHLAHLGEIGKPIKDNIGGWLAGAIENTYTPPKGFKTKAEKEEIHKAKQEREAKRTKDERAEAEASKQQKAKQRELDRRLDTLPEVEQLRISKEIETHLREGFDVFMTNVYATKTFDPKSALHRTDYYNYLERLLNEFAQ